MPQVDLSSVTGQELRQLLDASRRRGDAALSYKILQEMAARREGRAERGPFMIWHPAEPRLISVELGDSPPEDDDLPPMPSWRPPAHEPEVRAASAPEPESTPAPAPRRSGRKAQPAPAEVSAPPEPVAVEPVLIDEVEPPLPPLETHRPLSLWDHDPEPLQDEADAMDPGLRMHGPERESPPVSRPRRFRGVAGFALGAIAGIVLGWWAAGVARDGLPPLVGPIRTAALAPRAAPAPPPVSAPVAPSVAGPATALEASPGPAAGPPPPPEAQETAPPTDSAAAEPSPPASGDAETATTAETVPAASERSAPAEAKACASQPTPADRAICGDPKLRRLQGELRHTYAEALDAHVDRELLRQRQLAWAEARNTVTDPARLTRLYEERIRKLNAATAAARNQH